jgi:hypothetical protein
MTPAASSLLKRVVIVSSHHVFAARALGVGAGLLGVDGVVDDDPVAALAGRHATDRRSRGACRSRSSRTSSWRPGRLVSSHGSSSSRQDALVADALEDRAVLAAALALDQAAHLHAVALGEDLGVGGEQPPQPRLAQPLPRRPEHRHAQRLHRARRLVDDQPVQLPGRDGFEVLADRVDVPARDERGGGLDDRPGVSDERAESCCARLGFVAVGVSGRIEEVRRDKPRRSRRRAGRRRWR